MNKGQFPIACFFLIIVFWMYRVPGDKLYQLFPDLLAALTRWYVWGWITCLGVTFASFFSIKYLRRVHTREIQRLSNEKTKLQEKLLGNKVMKSSSE